MAETALTTTTGGAVATAGQWDSRQIDIIKRTIAPGISDDELYLFGMVCRRTGLDPFFKQIYAIKRSGKMTIQTGIDGYRLLADRTHCYAGSDVPEYDTEDAKNPTWAKVTVWKIVQGQRVAFTAKARWDEYALPTYDMWKKMPYLMLAKCAEALALRKAFPAELSGVYTTEEMQQADNDQHGYVEAVVTSVETSPSPAMPAQQPRAAAGNAQTGADALATERQISSIRKLCASLGRTEPDVKTLTFADASTMITGLSAAYAEARQGVAK